MEWYNKLKEKSKSFFSSIRPYFFAAQQNYKELHEWNKKNPKRHGSSSDFILKIAPLNEKKHDAYRNYFPPPHYGIPPGKSGELTEDHSKDHAKYGLFLWPDRLYVNIRNYFVLLLFTLLPFICLAIECGWQYLLVAVVLLVVALSIKNIFTLYARKSPPVLSNIWALWTESQYNRFLNVPHLSELASKDEEKGKEYFPDQTYWKPDDSGPLSYQPSYYAKGKKTLQEVMLQLALFNYLFSSDNDTKRKDKAPLTEKITTDEKNNAVSTCKADKQVNQDSNSLRLEGWFYLLTPAIISYVLLFIAFFISTAFYPPSVKSIPTLFRLPFFYVPLVLFWSYLTFKMILRQMRFLEKLQKEVREGYYDAHLDLIPQQLLTVISHIPNDKQIRKGMNEVAAMLRWVQAGALATFLIVLEIFASGF